jgi:hypothetical protein
MSRCRHSLNLGRIEGRSRRLLSDFSFHPVQERLQLRPGVPVSAREALA